METMYTLSAEEIIAAAKEQQEIDPADVLTFNEYNLFKNRAERFSEPELHKQIEALLPYLPVCGTRETAIYNLYKAEAAEREADGIAYGDTLSAYDEFFAQHPAD